MSLIVKSLSYIHPDKEVLFTNISFSLTKGQKVALVGNNGAGKSTLLRIAAGQLHQSAGEIIFSEKPYYVPQHLGQYDDYNIAEALGVEPKLKSLYAILKGDTSSDNFKLLDDDWNIEEKIKIALSHWNMQQVDLFQKMKYLSGGEKTKVFLSGILIHSPQVLLLDEPSNHLDGESRSILYDFVRKSKSTILIISHDRTLLNLLDTTLDIYNNSIDVYGGNYDFYIEQKKKKLAALQLELEEKEKNIKRSIQQSREVIEQRQKKEVRGKSQGSKGGMPRILAGGLGSKAEESSAKLIGATNDRINSLSDDLAQIKQQIEEQKKLKIDLKKSDLHKGRILVDLKNINFSYGEKDLWKSPLTLQILSGDRIRIAGNNGAGKTTLIKMIMSDLKASVGEVYIADCRTLYIDQEYSIIDGQLTVFEQVQRFNDRHLVEHELKMLLHHYQFPSGVWAKKCDSLSGGEKMKLLLCCITISTNSPDLLILDEPTNNLDMYSLEILTNTVSKFEGTILVISHDENFVNDIQVDRTIILS